MYIRGKSSMADMATQAHGTFIFPCSSEFTFLIEALMQI